jgi:hypothetical protein
MSEITAIRDSDRPPHAVCAVYEKLTLLYTFASGANITLKGQSHEKVDKISS